MENCQMSRFQITKMSPKGQIVIPEEIRLSMKLTMSDNFIVSVEKDTIILKPIKEPSIEECKSIIETARLQAKQVRLKQIDIKQAVKEVHTRK